MDVLSGKWTVVVVAHLKDGARRTSELRRLIPDISEKILIQRLRALEAKGIVERAVLSSTPPHVEYRLTPAGRTLEPTLQALYDWGDSWARIHDLDVRTATA